MHNPHTEVVDGNVIRTFPTGAIRDGLIDKGTGLPKPDYHRFLDWSVLTYYCDKYMLPNRILPNGQMREPDNWKKGFGEDVTMASLTRHYYAVWGKWSNKRVYTDECLQDLCGVMFNTIAMMREILEEME